MISIKLK